MSRQSDQEAWSRLRDATDFIDASTAWHVLIELAGLLAQGAPASLAVDYALGVQRVETAAECNERAELAVRAVRLWWGLEEHLSDKERAARAAPETPPAAEGGPGGRK